MKYYYIHHLSSSAINITKRAVGNTFSPGEPVGALGCPGLLALRQHFSLANGHVLTLPPNKIIVWRNKQDNGTLGYTQGPPVIKNQQKLKSRVGQFLRLLHKNFVGPFPGNFR